jgi:hypothetical protein
MSNKIAIGVITYHRNKTLENLLDSLIYATKKVSKEYNIVIILVDNDANGMARTIYEKFKNKLNIIYDIERTPGIPYARNKVLNIALKLNAKYIGFVDDDELVEIQWLKELITSIKKSGADVASGPTLRVSPKLNSKKQRDFQFRDRAETGNVLFKSWIAEKLRFDVDFQFTGGSDTFFFRQAHGMGAKIVFSPKAVAIEPRPKERKSLQWQFQRHFRYGVTHLLIEKKLGSRFVAQKYLVKSAVLIFVGGLEIIIRSIIQGRKGLVKGIERVGRGFGLAYGLFGGKYYEYKRALKQST